MKSVGNSSIINIKDEKNGNTFLMIAAYNGNEETVNFLVKLGVNLNLQNVENFFLFLIKLIIKKE